MFPHLMPVTQKVLWAMTIGFIASLISPQVFIQLFALQPIGGINAFGEFEFGGFLPWQLVTYALLHGDMLHLFLNGLALWMFGSSIEAVWGPKRYLTFLLVCVVGAGLVQLILPLTGLISPGITIGASGGVYGVLLAMGMMFPNQQVMLLIPPIPLKMRTLVIIFGALALYSGLSGAGGGIAHFAHLGGMLFGFLLIQYWRGRPPFNPRGPRRMH